MDHGGLNKWISTLKTIGFNLKNLNSVTCNLGYRRNWGSWDLSTDGCKEREWGHIWWWNLHWEIYTWCAASGEHFEPWTTQTGKEKALLEPFELNYYSPSRDDGWFCFINIECCLVCLFVCLFLREKTLDG